VLRNGLKCIKVEEIEVFFGEFRHNIDTKGRLSIPAKMRNQCQEKVFVTRGNDGCLALYTAEGWENYYKDLQSLSMKKKNNRTFIRLVTSRVSECEFDKLGRINIPLVLRQEGHLEKECVVVGVGDHVEIWNAEAWDQFYDENKDDFDDISEEIDEIEL
jgi:MraZ protein